MIKRRRRAGSAPKYRNQESPRTRSISDTETNERLREQQESVERKPSLKKLKTKIIKSKNNFMERKRKISQNVDRKINKMKTKMKEKVYNMTKKLPNRKRLSGSDKHLSIYNNNNNSRRSDGEDNNMAYGRDRGSGSLSGRDARSDGDVADVEFYENVFSDEDGNNNNMYHDNNNNAYRTSKFRGKGRNNHKGSKKMLERWKSWRKKQRQKEKKNDLQDFLAQDGSNMFVSQLQKLNRRFDQKKISVKWPKFKLSSSSRTKLQRRNTAEELGLDNLAPELRVLVLAETWDGLSKDRRRRLLRVKPSFAILPLERCLCPLHIEALSCLIRTRTVSELIPGYVESKTGQWWKMHGDEDTIQHKLARAMMNRSYFVSLQKKNYCPVCKKNLVEYKNEILSNNNDSNTTMEDDSIEDHEDSNSNMNSPLRRSNTLDYENLSRIRQRRTTASKLAKYEKDMKNRSLKKVLAEDTSELCYLLSSCTKAIIGIRVYSCLTKKYRRKKRDKNRMSLSRMRQMPNAAFKSFRASLKMLADTASGNNDSRSRARSEEEEEEEEEDEGYPEEYMCAICVDLLAKPCKLACGHTFCKVCLLKVAVMQQAKFISCLCPFCRRPFFFSDLKESKEVVSIVTKKYRDAYEGRILDTVQEEQDLLRNITKDDENENTSNEVGLYAVLRHNIAAIAVLFSSILIVCFVYYYYVFT